MMDWGIKKADEMGLESYIDATDQGRFLYERYGFIAAPQRALDPYADGTEPSQRWRDETAKEQSLLPMTWNPMWRPVLGKLKEGVKKPWDS